MFWVYRCLLRLRICEGHFAPRVHVVICLERAANYLLSSFQGPRRGAVQHDVPSTRNGVAQSSSMRFLFARSAACISYKLMALVAGLLK